MTPTTREAEIQELPDDELEPHETFFNNFTKRESCPACRRHHGNYFGRCERRGEKFRPEWTNKRVHQHNLQHGNTPKKPIAFGPPHPMDEKINKSPLITKAVNIVDDDQPEELDNRDAELSNMLALIETMEDDFAYTG